METYAIFRDLAIILISAKLCGLLAAKLKAPQVVGEIIAGLLIGPSVLGLVQQTELISAWPGAADRADQRYGRNRRCASDVFRRARDQPSRFKTYWLQSISHRLRRCFCSTGRRLCSLFLLLWLCSKRFAGILFCSFYRCYYDRNLCEHLCGFPSGAWISKIRNRNHDYERGYH